MLHAQLKITLLYFTLIELKKKKGGTLLGGILFDFIIFFLFFSFF